MYRYRAFDLRIRSEIELPELSVDDDADGAFDLEFAISDLGIDVPALGEPSNFDYEDPRGVLMCWPGALAARIESVSRVFVALHPGVPDRYLSLPLLGPVMGWLLYQRGLTVLHASAVLWNGLGIGFLGDKMAGKSTTAATLLKDGGAILTDDLLALRITPDERPAMLPAYGQVKLSEAASRTVALADATVQPKVMEHFKKQQHRLGTMQGTAVPGDCLFILNRADGPPRIDWMDQGKALTSMIRFSYNVRFQEAPLQMQDRQRQFAQAATIARQLRVGTLTVPQRLEELDQLIGLFESSLL